jgi:hypothetical protein
MRPLSHRQAIQGAAVFNYQIDNVHMPEFDPRQPFVNAAEKIAYYFTEWMTDADAYRALLDPRCHTQTDDMHVCENGEVYRVVRVSRDESAF